MKKKRLTTQEVLEATSLKLYQLQYLRNNNIIPSFRRGPGYPTIYPFKVVDIIKNRQRKADIEKITN